MTSRQVARYGILIHFIGATARPSIGAQCISPVVPDSNDLIGRSIPQARRDGRRARRSSGVRAIRAYSGTDAQAAVAEGKERLRRPQLRGVSDRALATARLSARQLTGLSMRGASRSSGSLSFSTL